MADEIEIPDESEQLDQLQADDTLVDRGVDDVLDEGYIAPDNWSPAQGFGNTAAEQAAGETLEMRIKQEVAEVDVRDEVDQPAWDADGEEREVGAKRAGRLVVVTDADGQTVAQEVGIAGGAACAEEAAMHVIEGSEEDEARPRPQQA